LFYTLDQENGMRRYLLIAASLSILICSGNTWASHYNEALIYTGPPEFGEVYDYQEHAPAYVSYTIAGKDMEAHADWWSVGGRMQNAWNNTYQGWSYLFSDTVKEFEVTAAGAASITFSWNGLLTANGSSGYDGAYYLFGQASIADSTLSVNPDAYWYYELDGIGSMNISETATFNYVFDEQDVGDLFNLTMTFDSQVGLNGGDIMFSGDDSLEFSSMFYNGLRIDSISGGIVAADEGGPFPAVPIPSAIWLLGTGLIALAKTGSRKAQK
jgi:hypothetical protein